MGWVSQALASGVEGTYGAAMAEYGLLVIIRTLQQDCPLRVCIWLVGSYANEMSASGAKGVAEQQSGNQLGPKQARPRVPQ